MKQLLILIFLGSVVQLILDYFFGIKSGTCYAFGFMVGMTYQGLCDHHRRIRVRDDMIAIMKQIQPRMKQKLTVVKKDK
jgi:hypothetical protein